MFWILEFALYLLVEHPKSEMLNPPVGISFEHPVGTQKVSDFGPFQILGFWI